MEEKNLWEMTISCKRKDPKINCGLKVVVDIDNLENYGTQAVIACVGHILELHEKDNPRRDLMLEELRAKGYDREVATELE